MAVTGQFLLHAVAELRGEGIGQELVAALEMKDFALEGGQAAQLGDRRLPEAEERGDIVARRRLLRACCAARRR